MYIPLTFEGALQKCLYASGGFEQGFFISGSDQYAYHLFKESGKLEVLAGTIDSVEILVVGGGGGGASGTTAGGGGGGGINFVSDARLYTGTYNIIVGKGGKGGVGTFSGNPGDSGLPSSFSGANIYMAAGGGAGGSAINGGSGGSSGTPTSFAGGTNVATRGGGGGGASANGGNASNSPARGGDGGAGLIYYFAGIAQSVGCGGGGNGASSGQAGGAGCQSAGQGGDTTNGSQPGANIYGGGGGGQLINFTSDNGGDGGSGSVLIQYKINDYCKNWFNETGSCGCSQATFDVSDFIDFYPNITGSYQYTPCGSNVFASGSLQAEFPLTVCAASNSFVWYQYSGSTPAGPVSGGGGGFVSGNNCFSASYGVQTCVPQYFTPTCTSSIFTFYAGTDGGTETLYWIPKNSSSISFDTLANNDITYKCVSTGSLGSIGYYPYGISGTGATIYATASCQSTAVTASWTSGFNYSFATYTYTPCGGPVNGSSIRLDKGVLGAVVRTANIGCVDTTFTGSWTFGGTGASVTVNQTGSCLNDYILTGSCGCP